MKDLASTPVTAIESIGPRIAGLLAEIDVQFVADICRLPVSQLHRAVSPVTNPERVAGWRAMAYLLWIPDMTPNGPKRCGRPESAPWRPSRLLI